MFETSNIKDFNNLLRYLRLIYLEMNMIINPDGITFQGKKKGVQSSVFFDKSNFDKYNVTTEYKFGFNVNNFHKLIKLIPKKHTIIFDIEESIMGSNLVLKMDKSGYKFIFFLFEFQNIESIQISLKSHIEMNGNELQRVLKQLQRIETKPVDIEIKDNNLYMSICDSIGCLEIKKQIINATDDVHINTYNFYNFYSNSHDKIKLYLQENKFIIQHNTNLYQLVSQYDSM